MAAPRRFPRAALRLLLFLAGVFLVGGTVRGATLLKYNFETGNTWTAMAGYSSTAGGSITSTPTVAAVGTADTYASATSSSGVQWAVNSSSATGTWTAGVDSGVLSLLATNGITNLGLLTLSFSLSASTSHPITVRIESYNASSVRTGGLATLIYPAAPSFYQRFAVDLSSMTADGAGTFDPTAPKVRIYFEIGSATGGDGWPASSTNLVKIDNVNYATPKYYVQFTSPGSDTANNGLTEAAPFKTPGKAVGLAAPGDIIVMKGTDTSAQWFTGNSVTFGTPGTPEAWIVLKNYPGQTPVLRYSSWNTIIFQKGSNGSIYAGTDVPSYIEVRGLTVRGYSMLDANGDRSLDPLYAPYIGLADGRSNCNGISVDCRYSTYKSHDIRIADNVVEYNSGGGIGVGNAEHISIENNICRYNCWWDIYATSGISILGGVDVDKSTTGYKFLIQGNQCYGNEHMLPWAQIQGFSDGNGIIVDSFNNNSYAGRVLVQNNLCYSNGGSGIHSYASAHVDIIHNTTYHNSASTRLLYPQIFDNSSTDVRILNNIMEIAPNPTGNTAFNDRITSTSYGSGTYIQNNLLWPEGAYGANPTGANYTPNVQSNPLFLSPSENPATNDFRLRAASPGLNNAQVLAYRQGLDLDRKVRLIDAADNRGAYQTRATEAYAPVFTPQPGNFTAAQSVTLASDTSGATIIYTTDGTTPAVNASGAATNGTVYTAAFSVGAATTVKAIAWKSGLTTSYASTAVYTFNTATPAAVPAPTFDQVSGTYSGTLNVALLTRTPGAYIRYTTDGTTPSATSGTWAQDKPVVVTSATTLKAVAFTYNNGRAASSVATGNYVVRGDTGSTTAGSSVDGFGGNKIRFSRFLAGSNLTVTRLMAKVGATTGSYRCAIYADSSAVPGAFLKGTAAVTNPAAGWQSFALTSAQALTSGTYYWLAIWSDNSAAGIYYSSTGGTLREATSTFSSTWPSTITTTAATNAGYLYSIFATTDYAPVVNAGADLSVAYGSAATLGGSATYNGVALGSGTLTTAWSVVSGPGTVSFGTASALSTTATFSAPGTYTLRLTGQDTLFTMWPAVTDDVVVTVQSSTAAAAPTFSPAAGTYTSAQTVTLASTTAGAVIHYTTNNTAPTSSSASVASGGAVVIDTTATLRAYTTAAGYVDSAETSGAYTIQSAPMAAGLTLFGTGAPTGSATVALPSNPSNLLVNPGFENGVTGWEATTGKTVVDGQTVRSGLLSGRPTAQSAGFFQNVTLTRGSAYIYSAWALESLSTTNSYTSMTIDGGTEVTNPFTGTSPVWQQVSRSFTFPAGTGTTGTGRFGAWFSSGSTGTVAFDDFELYETMVPGASYELGTRFTCSRYGQVTSLRAWHPVGGPSSYTLNLWDASGTLLASATASAGTSAGWVEAVLPSPVSIDESAVYTVSYAVPSGAYYQATAGGLATAVSAPPQSTAAGSNGVYAPAGGTFPSVSSGGTNYWTDARVLAVASPAAPSGIVRARFTDGAGSSAPQQYPGSGGDGWVGGWVSTSGVTAAAATASPLQTTTDTYLQVSRTGGTSTQEGVYRQWSTATRPDDQFARLTFDVRLDSSSAVFNSAGDNLTLAARATAGVATDGDTTFLIRAHGAAAGGLQAREWGVFNGQPGQTDTYDVNRLLPTGMIIQPGVTYSFTVDLYGAAASGNTGGRINGTYDVTISDGTRTVQVQGAGFLSSAYHSGSYLCVSTQQSATTHNLAFSVDTIEMTSLVPAALPPMAVWRAGYFNPPDLANPALQSTVWGDLADPDHDGRNNLLEYALDSDPTRTSTDGEPIAATDAQGRLTLTFLRARSELTYLVEGSDDLLVWTTVATNPGNVGDEVTVTDTSDGTAPRRFLRLRVTH